MIKQRRNFDCVLACLAMATNRDYNEMFSPEFCTAVENAQGCSGELLTSAYRLAGFEKNENIKEVYIGGQDVGLVRQMIWGRKALIQVPSLNYEGTEHMIYWNGHKILDPSTKQTYKFIQSIFPTYVIIFGRGEV